MKKDHKKKHSSFIYFFGYLRKVQYLFSYLFPLILVILVFVFFTLGELYKNDVERNRLQPDIFSTYKNTDYPVYNFVRQNSFYPKNTLLDANLSAQGAIVMDSDSKIVLFTKNQSLCFSMASTTKIMTALVGLEYYKLDDILTVYSGLIPGSVVGFFPGERVTFRNVMYGMLLPSGNDAATIIAQNYPGGEQMFVERMNQKAKELYLLNTHFSDPTGLDDTSNGDYTTVVDLAHLASYAIQNTVFSEIVGTKQKTIQDMSGKLFQLENLNKLLGSYGVIGIKTGFTEEAGGILVTGKNERGHTIIIVVMKSDDRFKDTGEILQAIGGNITFVPMYPE